MPRLTQGVGNVSVSGAASRVRVYWPSDPRFGNDAVGTAKLGSQPRNGFTQTNFGAGTQGTQEYKGMIATTFVNGIAEEWGNSLSWFTERPGGAVICENACVEIRLTAAFDAPVGVIAADYGILISLNENHQVNGTGLQTLPGVIFGPQNINTVQLRARAAFGGAQTVTETVSAANTPDVTTWNTYALRIVTGSTTSDPVLFGLINGVVVTPRISWTAAAGLLPAANAAGGTPSFQVGMSDQIAALKMYIMELCITVAQNEADLD